MASRAPDDADDLAHFAIDSPRADDDTAMLHADYDSSITTADEDGHLLPCSPGTLENGPNSPTSPPVGLTTADFALAARTSDIVSSYRDYLTEMEGVSAKNARTASEMEAIRGDLGAPNSGRGGARGRMPRIKESNVAFFEEAPRPPRFLRGALQDRRTKRRLLVAGVGVAILAVAGLAVYAANESEARSQQSPQLWDKEAADILEKEAEEMMRQHSAKPPKARAPAEVQSEKGAATKMIEEIIADSKAKVTGRGGKKSAKTGKEDTESKSAKGESPIDMSVSSSKSAKAFSGGDAASSKSGKAMSISSGKSEKEEGVFSISGSGSASSKAGKSSSDESATSTPPPPVDDEEVADAPTSEEVAPTPKPPVVSGKDTRSSALHLEEASLLYEAIGEQYGPEFFDRGSGWTGSSYAEAVAFCNDTYVHVEGSGGSGVPCSYEVYCPEGPDTIPFGGYRSGTAYAPFVSTEHWIGWVQLSEGHPCVTYSSLEPVPTPEETQTIMCCKSV
ncbi:hypothetical protein ACHAXT_011603 [Thalassiosira profunda]